MQTTKSQFVTRVATRLASALRSKDAERVAAIVAPFEGVAELAPWIKAVVRTTEAVKAAGTDFRAWADALTGVDKVGWRLWEVLQELARSLETRAEARHMGAPEPWTPSEWTLFRIASFGETGKREDVLWVRPQA